MTNILYIIAWTVLISTIPVALDITHGLAVSQRLPRYFVQASGRSYARSLAWFLAACAVALLVWGKANVGWTWSVLAILVCIPAAILFCNLVQATWRLYGGGVITAGLTIYLWSAAF